MQDISLVVVSCDAYTELGYIFFELQEKFMGWFTDNRYFINETKYFEYKNVITVHVGEGHEWSDKVRIALNSIHTKYVLFMLEDYFIGKEVEESNIKQAIDIMNNYNLKYYKIKAVPQIKGTSHIADFLVGIPANKRYGINLQAALFERGFLLDIVKKEGQNAWQVENELNKNVQEESNDLIPGCFLDKREIIDIHNGVVKGRWLPQTLSYFNSIGYCIDVGDRPIMRRKELIRMKIVGKCSRMFSAKSTRRIKRLLKRLGFKFVTD